MSIDTSKYKEVFVSESKETLLAMNTALIKLEKKPGARPQIDELMRAAHNMKSMAATMDYNNMAKLCHAMEDIMDQMRKKGSSLTSEMVDALFDCFDALEVSITRIATDEEEADVDPLVSRLEHLVLVPEEQPDREGVASEDLPLAILIDPNMVTENMDREGVASEDLPSAILIDPNMVTENMDREPVASEGLPLGGTPLFLEEIREIKVKVEILDTLMNLTEELLVNKMHLDQLYAADRIGEMSGGLDALGRFLSDLQYNVIQARMLPAGQVFQRFSRIVRDLARRENKRVNLVIEGAEMELDRKILDKLVEPLVHLLRNAVDHGIEDPQERKRLNKPLTGTVRLSCREEKGYAIVEVEDDGRGINMEEIKDVAVKKGIVSEAEASRLDHSETLSLLFDSRFTTTKKVTDVSGRGVGLNIVQRTVDTLGGRATIIGAPGEGLKVSMSFPLTLAIISSLLVEVGDEIYAIPLTNVVGSIRVRSREIRKMLNHEVVVLPERNVFLLRLGDVFQITREEREDTLMVIVNRGDEFIGLGVDSILDKQEIIVKPLNELLRRSGVFSGLTILGDGRPVLILGINYFFEGVPSEPEIVAITNVC